MVQTALRLCAAGLPCAPGRPCRAEGLGSGSCHRGEGQNLRYLPAAGTTPEDDAAGRDRRHRRRSLADRTRQWPWPRTRIADIVTNLTWLGAVVIAFDAVFSEPDRLNPEFFADTFGNLDEEMRSRLRALPSNDGSSPMPSAIRAWCSGESGGPNVRADLDTKLPVTGFAMLGEEPQPFMFQFPGPVAQRAGAGGGGGRARPVHHQARA